MFSSKDSVKQRKGASSYDDCVTILTSGCHFSGRLYCRGSSRIGGRIDGEIVSDGLLIIEEEAQIEANITAEEAIVQGHVKGHLTAKKRVELTETAIYEGDIVTPNLMIKEKAVFNGKSSMPAPKDSQLLNKISVKKTSKDYQIPKVSSAKNL